MRPQVCELELDLQVVGLSLALSWVLPEKVCLNFAKVRLCGTQSEDWKSSRVDAHVTSSKYGKHSKAILSK